MNGSHFSGTFRFMIIHLLFISAYHGLRSLSRRAIIACVQMPGVCVMECTGHALLTGINREPGMPACSIDDVARTPTEASDPWSFPFLGAWPNLSVTV